MSLLGALRVENLSVQLGQGARVFTAVEALNVQIEAGEFVCLLGPSGCGKSTLLGVLAGHITPSQGQALLDDKPIRAPHPERGMVFQQHSLLPWKKILHNVAFGLKMRGLPKQQRLAQALDMLQRVGLPNAALRYPAELSGGMQQRAEIARVMLMQPRVLLMDEPFGALDAQTRSMLQSLLLQIWNAQRCTVVFVTHDVEEALFLGDRVLVMGGQGHSPRPGSLLADIRLPFARPRSRDIVTSREFVEHKRHCLNLLSPEKAGYPLPRLSPLGSAPETNLLS